MAVAMQGNVSTALKSYNIDSYIAWMLYRLSLWSFN